MAFDDDNPNSSHDTDAPLPWTRIGLYAAVFLAVILWVSLSDGDYAAMARLFLRNLLRQLF